ncbi:hypothetical protein EDB83DRAFT_2525378 [Lactarius deliciosus]|nr:hypothetical protein EDB83DRAFT_2525378 [Lactarius deliciosus]
MLALDPHPPFAAKLSLTNTYMPVSVTSLRSVQVTVENPQIAFTQSAPPDGM